MRKIYLMTVIVLFAVGLITACSKGYQSQKTAGELTVTLSAGSYPLVKGDNSLTVKVADSSGKAVTDAQVGVRFYMPPMPGMAPMEFNTQAVAKGSEYVFSANPAMEGGWKIDVIVTPPGKSPVMTTFNVDAR